MRNDEKVIYGSTLKIRELYPSGSLMFVAEMNNEKNCIEGIGLIRNTLVVNKKHKIYQNSEYNRYIYRGNYWLSRQQIADVNAEILEIFDLILFKGKSHLKCRLGITVITERLFVHWDYKLNELKAKVKQLFVHYFKSETDADAELGEEEAFEIIPVPRKIKNRKEN